VELGDCLAQLHEDSDLVIELGEAVGQEGADVGARCLSVIANSENFTDVGE